MNELDGTKMPPLSAKLAKTLMAMLSTNTDDEAIELSPYSKTQFYRVKPQLIKYKEQYSNNSVTQSLNMLKALSPKSVQVLGEQLDEKRNGQLRNKAANDILDRVIAKDKGEGTQVNVRVLVMPAELIKKYGITSDTENRS